MVLSLASSMGTRGRRPMIFLALTAVIVECASQYDLHWYGSGLELDDRTDRYHLEEQLEGQVVGHPVGNVVLGASSLSPVRLQDGNVQNGMGSLLVV